MRFEILLIASPKVQIGCSQKRGLQLLYIYSTEIFWENTVS
jgi:hypothetical protein